MAKYRQVQTEFWVDPGIEDFSSEDKFFYIMLLTNPRAQQCGIYAISKKQMAGYLNYELEDIDPFLDRFEHDYKRIYYNQDTKEIAIVNWAKHNFINSAKVIKCILKELKEVKDKTLIPCVYRTEEHIKLLFQYAKNYSKKIKYPIDTLSIGYRECTHSIYIDSAIDYHTLLIDYGEEEKEKEKEEEKREEKEKEKREEKQKEKITLENLDQSVIHRCKKVFGKNIDEKTVPVLYKIQTRYGIDLIQLAIDQTLKESSKNIDTTIAILEFWIKNGATTTEQVKQLI